MAINGLSKICVRGFGVQISDDSSYSKHISAIVRTYFKLKQFNNSFVCRESRFIIFMYTTYIQPHNRIQHPNMVSSFVERHKYCRACSPKKITKFVPSMVWNTWIGYRDSQLQTQESQITHFDLPLVFNSWSDRHELRKYI